MRARGEEVRVDDTPEVLSKRLASYRSLTEPLIHYYSERRKLLTVDGMMTIEHVTREINRILAAIGAVEAKAAKKAAQKASGQAAASGQKAAKSAKKAAKRGPESRQNGRQGAKRLQKGRPPKGRRKSGLEGSQGEGRLRPGGRKSRQKGHEKAS